MNRRNSALGHIAMDAARGAGRRARLALALAAFYAAAAFAQAHTAPPPYQQQIGDYTVYYNAVRTSQLPKSVLSARGLGTPSEHVVLLDVAVRKDRKGRKLGKSVPAHIVARALNLSDDVLRLKMHPAKSNGLISYVGTVHIAAREALDFHLRVRPKGARQTYNVEFREHFVPPERKGG